ncbi:MAG TPA: ribosome biogenesis GTPase Der [Candidatus Sulfotelmatobacter sp.]|nr:ribosome biogenesis GTPase Der [Candidatus Sulfotelmatobacter sp.]
MPAPVVAIIGRPNVGKSTFFNRVLRERRAVVHDRPGITRDRNTARSDWNGRHFMLVDTGGFLPAAGAPGELQPGRDAAVRRQAEMAMDLAQVVLFLVDAKTGVTDLDAAIAQILRRRKNPSLLVVNKVDKPADPIVHEFHRLGLGEPFAISAENGTGIGDLLDQVVTRLPAEQAAEVEPRARVAIIGRPNVGKSSLVNALLGEERMLVEPQPGTTMDAVDSTWSTPVGDFVLVDTAGIRRQAHFGDQAEFFATVRALQSLERADLAVVVVDSTQGFQRQEARLAHQALEAGCSVLLIYNKWDLITDREAAWKRVMAERKERYPTLADLPAMPLSATTHLHLAKLSGVLQRRIEEHSRRIPTGKLNEWLEQVQRRRQAPATRSGKAPRIYYLTQTSTRPPEFTLFVNAPSRLSENYRRFLWLQFTDHFDFHGTPVKLRVRKSD